MKKVLYINNFAKGTIKYFEPYFLSDWEIIYDSPTPDIISVPSIHEPNSNISLVRYGEEDISFPGDVNPIQIFKARMRFGWQPLICLVLGDPQDLNANFKLADYYFSFFPTDDKNHLRNTVPKSQDTGSYCPSTFNTKHPLSTRTKTKFCNFVYSSLIGGHKKNRADFCKLLMKYKKVDCPGEVLNNMARIESRHSKNWSRAKLDFISSYKFTIAFENASNDYYISEKIFHPLMVGSIPIYWGCKKIEEYINPNAIINCLKFNSFDEVIEKVKEIDNSPDLYQQYINAKPILPNSRFYQNERELKQRIQHIASEALKRRKIPNKWISLQKFALFVWEHKKHFVRYSLIVILQKTKLYLFISHIRKKYKEKILKKKPSATPSVSS